MEMPTPCENCDDTFDLNDGKGSPRRDHLIVICAACADKEEAEIEREEEIAELREQISEAEYTIRQARERLTELNAHPVAYDKSGNRETELFLDLFFEVAINQTQGRDMASPDDWYLVKDESPIADAATCLLGAGLLEKHPEKDWYRRPQR